MASFTVVTLVDDDGYEFPIAMPGVFRDNQANDVEAALEIAKESIRDGAFRPNGELKFDRIEYSE